MDCGNFDTETLNFQKILTNLCTVIKTVQVIIIKKKGFNTPIQGFVFLCILYGHSYQKWLKINLYSEIITCLLQSSVPTRPAKSPASWVKYRPVGRNTVIWSCSQVQPFEVHSGMTRVTVHSGNPLPTRWMFVVSRYRRALLMIRWERPVWRWKQAVMDGCRTWTMAWRILMTSRNACSLREMWRRRCGLRGLIVRMKLWWICLQVC